MTSMIRSKRPVSCRGFLSVLVSILIGLYIGLNLSGLHYKQNAGLLSADFDLSNANILREHKNEMENIRRDLQEAKILESQWKAKAKELEKQQAASINRIHSLEEHQNCQTSQLDNEDNWLLDSPPRERLTHPHPICQRIQAPTPSAMALWIEHINTILHASKLPNDKSFKFHDFTAQLLQIITPRLPRSIKSIPHEWTSVEHTMTIAWERYQYLQLPSDERSKLKSAPPRPLKILVMGGSLLVGTNCRKLLTELGLSFRLPNRDCTWSNRLMQFFNSVSSSELVEVTKVAMGGTNSQTGNIIWQYDLIPEDSRNPDIVINAYSTNDMHILTILDAQSSNITLRDKIFEMTQDFVRNVLYTCDNSKHPAPLLLHVDDYLGNEQREIWATTELSQGVQVLANYYGFASISYADVVREIVYGDTKESWLSSNWWDTGSFEREIHPGMGMHIASTWVIAFNLLNMVTTYCSIPTVPSNYNINEYRAGYLGLPNLKNDIKQAENKPHAHPKGLPPRLTKELLIEDVTAQWEVDATQLQSCHASTERKNNHLIKCPFSWVSGLSLQQNNETWIQEYFQRKATIWNGWVLSNDGGKLGFIPKLKKSGNNTVNLDLQFSFEQSIRSVTLFFMKSYGEKWRGSRLQLDVWEEDEGHSERLQAIEISGIHNKQTSEMYTEEILLPKIVPTGSTLRVETSLVGGSMFKIMGLAICS